MARPTGYEIELAAKWMYDQFNKHGELDQAEAAEHLAQLANGLVYENENGNPAISRKVLKRFRQVTERTAVWDRWARQWRRREPGDSPGRLAE